MRTQQQEITRELHTLPNIDPREEIEKRTNFLVQYLAQTGLNGFVLGISGGQDSLLAGLLTQRAVTERRRTDPTAKFHAMLLPYGTQADREDVVLACQVIHPDIIHDFDIQPGVDSLVHTFATVTGTELSDFDKGNVKARMRMIAQYAVAGSQNLLVIGTDHAAEAVMGFFTKYGDGGADIAPLAGLTKGQGKLLLKELGVPEQFITKSPSADLLDSVPQQADETELGVAYTQIDRYLEGRAISDNLAAQIEARYNATRHKREQPVSYK